MKYVIINADDFGLTRGVNEGIIKAFKDGILTSTTAMVNMPAFENAVVLAKENPGLGIGIHLVATLGRPVLPAGRIPGLVGSDGLFHRKYAFLVRNLVLGKIKIKEIEAEFSAQIEKFGNTGLRLTHVDSHQHVHMFPPILDVVVRLCKKYNISKIRKPNERYVISRNVTRGKITYFVQKGQFDRRILSIFSHLADGKFTRNRIATTDYCYGILHGGEMREELLENMLYSLKDGTTEIVCHPGYVDAELRELNLWISEQRRMELNALADSSLRKLIEELGIKLISFRELR